MGIRPMKSSGRDSLQTVFALCRVFTLCACRVGSSRTDPRSDMDMLLCVLCSTSLTTNLETVSSKIMLVLHVSLCHLFLWLYKPEQPRPSNFAE